MTIIADGNGNYDGAGLDLVHKLNVEMPILFISRVDGYVFNEKVLELEGKDYCIVDYTELGWNWSMEFSHLWGVNTDKFDFLQGEEWAKLDAFIKDNPPKISFIRELLKEDYKDNVHPISYACFLPAEPIETFEQFNKRPLQMIFSWGLSHEYRKDLHAQIWQNAGKHGYIVNDNLYYLNNFVQKESNPNKWFTCNIPWYSRHPMNEFIKINGWAKISVSIAGAGRSCFRHGESPINSAMLMWGDNLAWHEWWEHGKNCIKCKQGEEIETILEWLKKPEDLYNVYKNGVETVDKFRFENYVPYLESLINKTK